MPVYIYALLDPETNAIRYIGKSVEPKSRLAMHIFHATHGANTHKDRWIRQLLALGLKPVMQIVEETNEADWQEREKHWIAFYRANGGMTNITDGGAAISAPRTEIWAKKIGDAHRGKTIPQETRERISATNRAKNDAGCKRGHAWTPENTIIVTKGTNSYRSCRICKNESQKRTAYRKGAKPKKVYTATRTPLEYCHAGHQMTADNLRLLTRRGYTERICRQCVRVRNQAAKKRARERKKENK